MNLIVLKGFPELKNFLVKDIYRLFTNKRFMDYESFIHSLLYFE